MSSFVLNGSAASANYMQSQLPYHLPEYYQQTNPNQLIPANHTPLDYAQAVSAAHFPYGYSNNGHSFQPANQQLNLQLPTSNNLHPSLHNQPPPPQIGKTAGLTAAHPSNGQSPSAAAVAAVANQQLSVNLPPTTSTTASTVQNHLSSILPHATNSHRCPQNSRYQNLFNSSNGAQSAGPTNSPINHHQPNYHNADLLTTVNANGSYSGSTTPLNGASVLNSPANHNSSALLSEAEGRINNLPNNYPYNPFNSTEFNRHLSSYNGSPLLGSGSTNSPPNFAAAQKTANDQFLSSIQSGQNSHLNNLNNHLANQHLNNLANHNGSYTSPLAALSNAVNNGSFIPTSAPFQCKTEPTPDSPPESTSSNSLHSMNGIQNGHQLTNSLTNGNSIHHHDYKSTINPGQTFHHPSLVGAHQLHSSTNDSCSMMSIDNNNSQNTFSSSNQKAHIYPWMKKNSQVNAGKFVLCFEHFENCFIFSKIFFVKIQNRL